MSEQAMESRYDGPDYGPETEPEDAAHYSQQQLAIRVLLCDGIERSAVEICDALGIPQTTRVDSRVRDLRKVEHGAWPIVSRRCADEIYRYKMMPPGTKVVRGKVSE